MPSMIGRCGGGSCTGIIDSTADVGDDCGVHSVGQGAGLVLTSDGADGSLWAPESTFDPQSAEELLASNLTTIPGTDSAFFSLHSTGGSSFLNLASPPTVFVGDRGIYAFSITAVVLSNSATHNQFQLVLHTTMAAIVSPVLAQNVFSDIASSAIQAEIGATCRMDSGDSFQIELLNQDSAARDFQVVRCSVTRILLF